MLVAIIFCALEVIMLCLKPIQAKKNRRIAEFSTFFFDQYNDYKQTLDSLTKELSAQYQKVREAEKHVVDSENLLKRSQEEEQVAATDFRNVSNRIKQELAYVKENYKEKIIREDTARLLGSYESLEKRACNIRELMALKLETDLRSQEKESAEYRAVFCAGCLASLDYYASQVGDGRGDQQIVHLLTGWHKNIEQGRPLQSNKAMLGMLSTLIKSSSLRQQQKDNLEGFALILEAEIFCGNSDRSQAVDLQKKLGECASKAKRVISERKTLLKCWQAANESASIRHAEDSFSDQDNAFGIKKDAYALLDKIKKNPQMVVMTHDEVDLLKSQARLLFNCEQDAQKIIGILSHRGQDDSFLLTGEPLLNLGSLGRLDSNISNHKGSPKYVGDALQGYVVNNMAKNSCVAEQIKKIYQSNQNEIDTAKEKETNLRRNCISKADELGMAKERLCNANHNLNTAKDEFLKFNQASERKLEKLKFQIAVVKQKFFEFHEKQLGFFSINRLLVYGWSLAKEKAFFERVQKTKNYGELCLLLHQYFDNHPCCREGDLTSILMQVLLLSLIHI